jgi:hypothetical protein
MASASGAAGGAAQGAAAGSVFGPIGTLAGGVLGGLGGVFGGGGDTPLPPKEMNSTATSGGSTGGAFVFGNNSKSSIWPIVAIVGVLVVGALVWIGPRKR